MCLSLTRSRCCENLGCSLHSRVAFTGGAMARIDARTEKIKSIGLLQEYRTALISAAVTGKIARRSAAEHGFELPPEAERICRRARC